MRFPFYFLVGVSLALQITILPSLIWLWLVVPLLFCFTQYPVIRCYLALPFAVLWVIAYGNWGLSSTLPSQVVKKDVLITGVISSLPERSKFSTRFVFDVESMSYQGVHVHAPKRIRLDWYRNTPNIQAGEKWQLNVRLKPAHGMQNPGGFDYEKWLFERGIRATGYVRESDENSIIESPNPLSALHLRASLKKTIVTYLPESQYRGLVLALAVGDRSEISDAQWDVLTATGTNHLVAISGLHIGLVAGGAYFIFLVLFKRSRGLLLYCPAHKLAAIVALLAAFFYAMLAGFAIPTQRALVMTSVVMIGILINQRFSLLQILGYALFAVLLFDPLSALSPGFWLSFIAVAAILYTMQGRFNVTGLWWKWGRIQWVVTLALAPVLIFLFQSFSVISPVANILAVPWVSFVTVPLLFLGMLFSFIEPVGKLFMVLAATSLEGLWIVLDYLAGLHFSLWQQFTPQSWTLFPACIGVLLLISPRGFPARYLAILLLMPLFIVKPAALAENELRFYLLDVGLGLSAVVQTRHHVLVFDTGPKFRSGFDTGEAVVLPFLRSLAVEKVDVLVISHGDNDHIGGMQSIIDKIPVTSILSGDMNKTPQANAEACVAGREWHWDGVEFEILHPDKNAFLNKGNNGSCVLKVSVGEQSILLTGDIEKTAESFLVAHSAEKIEADVLIAAHHGSNTSSTSAFIKTVNPEWVLFPAGYQNRFKFPTGKIRQRFVDANIPMLTTGNHGAISFHLTGQGDLLPSQFRTQNRRFWHQVLPQN